MLEYINKGISIIIEFGNYTSTFVYLLIANIITRRIHTNYIEKTEQFLGSQQKELEPKKLMITIEEAHKFLNPSAARQTIFGTIAREMRKYYVSLLVVDQRPSGIDEEILSQIGTKIVAQLNDEKDIQAVLTGVNNASNLRSILASLDSKKQALLLGHAVAMPVVIQTREYDEQFYRAMQDVITSKKIDEFIKEIF
jgi:DNA helicase HerA-like ATPase